LGVTIARGDTFCSMTNFAYSTPGNTSLILQSEIAIGFCAAIFRKLAWLRLLERALLPTWLVGLALAMANIFTQPMCFDDVTQSCIPCEDKIAIVTVVTYLVTLTIGICCHVPSLWKSRLSGHAVQKRIRARAAVFPIVFLFTCAPITLGLLRIEPFKSSDMYWSIAGPMYSLNGFLNVVVYACTNRRLRDETQIASPLQVQSVYRSQFPVGFQAEVSVARIDEDGLAYSHDLLITKKKTPSQPSRSASFSTRRDSARLQRWSQVESGNYNSCFDKRSKGQPQTTVMLRNIPNEFTRDLLLEVLDENGLRCCYDFVYLPHDFKKKTAAGFAFVNFTTNANAEAAFTVLQSFSKWKTMQSVNVLEVTWAHPLQGLDAHVDRFKNSSIMHADVPDEYKPVIFENGLRVDFPAPTQKLRLPLAHASCASVTGAGGTIASLNETM